jgi:hypothetical protein
LNTSGGSSGELAGTETVSGTAGGALLGVVSTGFAAAAFVASAGFALVTGGGADGASGFVVVAIDAEALVGTAVSAVPDGVAGAGVVAAGVATDAAVDGALAASTGARRRVTRMPTPIATIMPTAAIGSAS